MSIPPFYSNHPDPVIRSRAPMRPGQATSIGITCLRGERPQIRSLTLGQLFEAEHVLSYMEPDTDAAQDQLDSLGEAIDREIDNRIDSAEERGGVVGASELFDSAGRYRLDVRWQDGTRVSYPFNRVKDLRDAVRVVIVHGGIVLGYEAPHTYDGSRVYTRGARNLGIR